MLAVILAGGKGKRIRDNSASISVPKPLIEIGGTSIIEHIMGLYSSHGHNEFIICGGYKVENFITHFEELQNDMGGCFIDFEKNERKKLKTKTVLPWKVSIIDTGYNTMTGGRIARVKQYIDDDTFFVTYGDAVADIDVSSLLAFHKKHGRLATLTAVHPPQRFGTLDIELDNKIMRFKEKDVSSNLINGGFFVFSKKIFDYIESDETVLEKDVLGVLAEQGELYAYKHEGFWQCMDLIHEQKYLNWVWNKNKTWKVGKNSLYSASYHEEVGVS